MQRFNEKDGGDGIKNPPGALLHAESHRLDAWRFGSLRVRSSRRGRRASLRSFLEQATGERWQGVKSWTCSVMTGFKATFSGRCGRTVPIPPPAAIGREPRRGRAPLPSTPHGGRWRTASSPAGPWRSAGADGRSTTGPGRVTRRTTGSTRLAWASPASR